jgi:predicted Zn-dependent peptidase
MSDPPELPGLAHFTEHMLFYASEKYPEVGQVYPRLQRRRPKRLLLITRVEPKAGCLLLGKGVCV